MIKKPGWCLLVFLSLSLGPVLVTGSVAAAPTGGTKTGPDVTIVANAQQLFTASGALGTARNENPNAAAVSKQIGCRLVPNLTGTVAECWATNATAPTGSRQNLFCSTGNRQLIEMIHTLNGDSLLSFSTYLHENNAGDFAASECTCIIVENSSQYFPKEP